jgi:hypothetical protein
MRAGFALLCAVLLAANVATPGSFLRDAAFHLVAIIAIWFGVTRIVRFNVMGYFLLAAIVALAPGAMEMLDQPNPYFHANGYVVIAFALAVLAGPLIHWRRNATAA